MLEGRVTEQSVGIQDLRAGQREINGRIDRMFWLSMGIGAAQIGLLITLITLIVRID